MAMLRYNLSLNAQFFLQDEHRPDIFAMHHFNRLRIFRIPSTWPAW